MLTPGGAGAYDAGAGGVSARCVVAHSTDPLCLLMLYEALNETRSHAMHLPRILMRMTARISQILRTMRPGRP